jgi:hypothetical protein
VASVGDGDHEPVGVNLQIRALPLGRELRFQLGQLFVNADRGDEMLVGQDQPIWRDDGPTAERIPDHLLLTVDAAAHDDRKLDDGVDGPPQHRRIRLSASGRPSQPGEQDHANQDREKSSHAGLCACPDARHRRHTQDPPHEANIWKERLRQVTRTAS